MVVASGHVELLVAPGECPVFGRRGGAVADDGIPSPEVASPLHLPQAGDSPSPKALPDTGIFIFRHLLVARGNGGGRGGGAEEFFAPIPRYPSFIFPNSLGRILSESNAR